MATEPGPQFSNPGEATEVLFGVQFSDPGAVNSNTIEANLNTLVANGQLSAAAGPGGSVEYTNTKGELFFYYGPEFKQASVTVDPRGGSIVNTNKSNQSIEAGNETNNLQFMDGVRHVVHTRGGDDTVAYTGTGKVDLNTGAGNDTVTVTGGTGSKIKTKAGDDTVVLDHGSGNNHVWTGSGADRIIIGPNETGRDRIYDFSKKDVLQIMDRNGDGKITIDPNGGDVLKIQQHGPDTIITLTGGEQVVLKNVNHKHLHQDDDGTFHLS
jgi:hypothetical protein